MARQDLAISNEDRTQVEALRLADHPLLLAGSAFAIGMAAGFWLKAAAEKSRDAARRAWSHRQFERTITYGDNLPDQLARREQPDQPRFGGTGAIGVSPESAPQRPTSR
jgi:hypothetical protein